MTKKIPKRIAGVKLNKKLRKRGNELLALADTPQGRETIAMGLSMAAAAASVALKRRSDDTAREAPTPAEPVPPAAAATVKSSDAPRPGGTKPDPAPIDPEKIIAAVGQTIETAMARFFAGSAKH